MARGRKGPAAKTEHQPVKGPRVKKGLVIINTGEGKGKTTAALGVLFRAWGRKMKVRMFQFLKHTGAQFGEQRAAKAIGVSIQSLGDGFTWLSKDMDRTQALAVAQWQVCKEAILEGDDDIVILDEFTYAMHYGWVEVEEVIDALNEEAPAEARRYHRPLRAAAVDRLRGPGYGDEDDQTPVPGAGHSRAKGHRVLMRKGRDR